MMDQAITAARKAIEATYTETCTVYVQGKYRLENKATGFRELVWFGDEPCGLSFSTAPNTSPSDTAAGVTQRVKLFLAPEKNVPAGSKIVVLHRGTEKAYTHSGLPKAYDTHQSIELENFDGWA